MNDEEQNHSAFFIKVKNPAEREELKPGDLIEIFRSSSPHWAIYLGDGKVLHLAPECDCLADGTPNPLVVLSDRAYVRKDWLEDVVKKDRYRVNNKHDETQPPLPLAKILWQAEDLVDKEAPYSFTSQNCEHFVMELRYGAEMNEQEEIKPGDLIEIFRSCYQHWAIYVGEGKVVHLAPECDRLANGAASVLAVLADRAYVKKRLAGGGGAQRPVPGEQQTRPHASPVAAFQDPPEGRRVCWEGNALQLDEPQLRTLCDGPEIRSGNE
ncbi:hypothetical protein JRQ81_009139 [Phrynocephalus forsythii]|uniref:LRAT domain-containing protein n=1 Tax=Phrynocephalus forsythii TaxID=171643 RepID=A0A9Q0XBC1_9SAUR|nr:hypothetical protein JRQ81_009139 [Phrynocephalus forsythii]